MDVRWEGTRELARALRRLPEIVAEQILEQAVVVGADIIRQAAAERAPRAAVRARGRHGTVRLADSFKVTVTEKSRSFVTVNVGTKIPYAHLVEYGHQIVPRGPSRATVSITTVRISKKTGKQVVSAHLGLDPLGRRSERRAATGGMVAARPFLRPAFDDNRELVLRRIGEVIGRGIEGEARKLAGITTGAVA